MVLETSILCHSGASFEELYEVLSSEGIHNAEVKSGVLLYMVTPESLSYICHHCCEDRDACVQDAGGCVVHDDVGLLVAEWTEENMQLSDAISQAVQCALDILDLVRAQTRVHKLSGILKIAIAAGRFSIVGVGNERMQVCVAFGPVVEEIRTVVPLAMHGDIVLSPEAWRLCNRQNLIVEPIDNDGTVKVQHYWNQQSVLEEMLSFHIADVRVYVYPIRTFLLTNEEIQNIIRRFMLETVVDNIDENMSLQDFSHTWPISIMLMNLQYAHTDLNDSEDEVSSIVAEEMLRCRGELCDVFFLEEGCVFVCAVGLPDGKRQDMAASALQAANSIHETCLRRISNLWMISIAVTTGRIWYEFQETPLGNRYTVYGYKLREARDLMMDNLGIVSCDTATKLYSMLPLSHIMPQAIFSPHEEVRYCDEISQMLANEAGESPRELDGMRLALAHMQTMFEEVQVVKYASVIGHTFSIDMLKKILPNMSEEELIDCLRSLVRVGIIECASISGDNSSTKTCDCNKFSEEYTNVSMDPVWPCPLMSFCNSDEMEAVYKLVQKEETLFQSIQCAFYLENQTYRCSKCRDKTFMFEHKATTDDVELLQEIYKTIRPCEVFQRQGNSRRNKIYPDEGNGNETVNSLSKVKTVLTEGCDRTTAGSCECAQLVETVLIPRIKHWRCAGDMPKTFYYLLESAAACVYLQNDAQALEYLTEARSIVENGYLPEFPLGDPRQVEICEKKAFMYRLTGEILFRAGNIMEAEESIRKSLKLLNCKLPRNNSAQSLKLVREKMKNLLYRSRQFEIPEKTKLGCLQERIDCLSLLWQISHMRGQHKTASLAITMQINLAIRSTDPYKILYSAIDYLKYSHFKGEESKCRCLKDSLCRTHARLSDHPEGQLLNNQLTQALALVKMCPGDLEQSV